MSIYLLMLINVETGSLFNLAYIENTNIHDKNTNYTFIHLIAKADADADTGHKRMTMTIL